MEPNWTALAAAIKMRRLELRFSQDGLANEAGISRSTIQKLEWGSARPEYKTLQLVERALGWRAGSADDVLRGMGPQLASSNPEDEYAGRRPSSTAPDMVTVLDHIVFDLAVHMAPDMPLAEVRELQERALETARKLGLPLPHKRAVGHSNGDPEN